MRITHLLVVTFMLLLMVTAAAECQDLASSRMAARSVEANQNAIRVRPPPPVLESATPTTSRIPYFVAGAAIGAGFTTLIAYRQTQDSDCTICHPVLLVPVALVGGLAGGLGGLVVHGWITEDRNGRYIVGATVRR